MPQVWLVALNTRMQAANRKILLLYDNAPVHKAPEVELSHVAIAKLPKNTTAMLQPMDQGEIAWLKGRILNDRTADAVLPVLLGENDPYAVDTGDAMGWLGDPWDAMPEKTAIVTGLTIYRDRAVDSSTANVDVAVINGNGSVSSQGPPSLVYLHYPRNSGCRVVNPPAFSAAPLRPSPFGGCVEAGYWFSMSTNAGDQAPPVKTTEHQELVKANLFSRAFPNLRVLFLPLRFVGYWLQWKLWSQDPNARQAETLVDNIIYGEDPRFRTASHELYFVDMHGKQVLKYSLASRKTELVYEDPEDMLSGLGWLADGRMLIVSMNKRRVLVHDEKASSTEVYADVRAVTSFRANDMVVAPSGRAYVGSFGFDMANVAAYSRSAIISVGPKRDIRVEAPDMIFPNGMVITPDGKTLIAAETFAGLLTAFDVDEDGQLSNRRVWANVGSFVDGICLDADGCIWASIVQPGLYQLGGGLIRVKEGGQILDVLGFGANGIKNSVFACQLGTDADGKHLLFFMEAVTSYDHLIYKDGIEAAKKNGSVRAIKVSVGPARIPSNDGYCGGHC